MDNVDLDKARNWLESHAAAATAVATSLKDSVAEKASQFQVPDGARGSASEEERAKAAEKERIEKNDLMHLCMKMNKKIKSMDAKMKELEGATGSLLDERRALVTVIKAHVPIPIVIPPGSSSGVGDKDNIEAPSDAVDVEKIDAALRAFVETWEREKADLLAQISSSEPLHTGTTGSHDNGGAPDGALRAKEAELSGLRSQIAHLKGTMREQEALFVAEKAHLKETIKDLELKVGEFTDKTRELGAAVEAAEKTARDLSDANQTVNSLSMILEEKELSDANQKEMIQYLQERLNDIDKANEQITEENKAATSQLSSHQVLKAEQEALLTSLRVSLQEALDNNGKLEAEVVVLRMFKDQHESKVGALEALGEESEAMRDKLAEQTALITRLRQEGEKSGQAHAMRTAMLATTEGELEQARGSLKEKELELEAAREQIDDLRAQLTKEEGRQEEKICTFKQELAESKAEQERERQAHSAQVRELVEEQHAEADKAQREFAKKSNIARQLLQEKEEDIRLLNEKIEMLMVEIRSGAPSERRIFEIAKTQAQREHLHSVKLDTRETAFQQLQEKLSLKDLQLAQLQTANSGLQAEVAQLSRVAKREGVNMDYLKNVVLQYITFPLGSPERESLVPVIAMLLQFSTEETKLCESATSSPSWTARLPIEINVEALRAKSSQSSHG